MKSEQLYRELKDLAEKLGLQVYEQNFRPTGIHVRSGHCLVKGKDHCIIDKHIKLAYKIEVLAECISMMPHESVYVVPAVREFLDQFKPKAKDTTSSETNKTETDDASVSGETDIEPGAPNSSTEAGNEPSEIEADKDSD